MASSQSWLLDLNVWVSQEEFKQHQTNITTIHSPLLCHPSEPKNHPEHVTGRRTLKTTTKKPQLITSIFVYIQDCYKKVPQIEAELPNIESCYKNLSSSPSESLFLVFGDRSSQKRCSDELSQMYIFKPCPYQAITYLETKNPTKQNPR